MVQVTEAYLPLAQHEEIGSHNAHDGRQEDDERAQDTDERGSPVDELPRLTYPGGYEGDKRASADVDVARE